MEFVVAKVQRGVDGLEGLKVDVDPALLAFCGDNFTAVDDEAIGGDLGVELEALLGGGNGGEDGETVDAGLDVGGGTLRWLVLIWGCCLGLLLLLRQAQWWEEAGVQILQPTSWRRAKPDPWALCMVSRTRFPHV
jgi:hypothetical protein